MEGLLLPKAHLEVGSEAFTLLHSFGLEPGGCETPLVPSNKADFFLAFSVCSNVLVG